MVSHRIQKGKNPNNAVLILEEKLGELYNFHRDPRIRNHGKIIFSWDLRSYLYPGCSIILTRRNIHTVTGFQWQKSSSEHEMWKAWEKLNAKNVIEQEATYSKASHYCRWYPVHSTRKKSQISAEFSSTAFQMGIRSQTYFIPIIQITTQCNCLVLKNTGVKIFPKPPLEN